MNETINARIVATFGSTPILIDQFDLIWSDIPDDMPADQQYLVAKIAAIDLLLGSVWTYCDFRALDGASVSAGQMFDNLLKLRGLAADELAALAGGTGGAIGVLTRTAPQMPPAGMPDANDPIYRGDPYGAHGVIARRIGR